MASSDLNALVKHAIFYLTTAWFCTHIGPVPSPRGALVGLASPNKIPRPPKLKRETLLVEFLLSLEYEAPTEQQKTLY